MKKLIFVVLIIFVLFLCFTFLFGKSNNSIIDDALIDNKYVLENDVYRKVVSNNTQEDFYNDIKNNRKSEYIEYQYIPASNLLKGINLKFDSLYYLCDITEDFSNNKLEYSCNSIYEDKQLNIYGNFNYSNNSFSCSNRDSEISEDITSEYCNEVYKQIEDFIVERNKLFSNKKFEKAIKG